MTPDARCSGLWLEVSCSVRITVLRRAWGTEPSPALSLSLTLKTQCMWTMTKALFSIYRHGYSFP